MPRKRYEPGYSRIDTRQLTTAYVQMGASLGTFSLKGLANSLRDAGVRLNKQQQAFIAQVGVIPGPMRRQLHEDVGAAAQRSVVAAYAGRRYRRGTAPYRTTARDKRNRRFAGGLLLRALQAPDFYVATENVLYWGNISRLSQEAAQWKRLNFGAGRGANAAPARFAMQWGEFVGEAIGMEPDPQPAFRIPKGFWLTAGGGARARGRTDGAEFYPVGEQPPGRWGRPSPARMTGGIAGSNFMDAGFRRIATEYPRAVSTMMTRIYRNKPLAQKLEIRTNVRVPMPSGVQHLPRARPLR